MPIIIKKPKVDSPFRKSKSIQEEYARALRGVAKEVGKLVIGYSPTDQLSVEKLRRALRAYSEILGPWALNLSAKILKSVENQDLNAWRRHSKLMAYSLRQELLNAPTGEALKKLMDEQVTLIQSIPLEAADRVHNLVVENLMRSARADEIAQKIMQTESVAKSRATLIARTEIARAASILVQVRAQYVESPGYVWKTSKDLLVRKSHKEMDGKYVEWNNPPTLDKMIGHAGGFPNCRCWPDPIIPEGE